MQNQIVILRNEESHKTKTTPIMKKLFYILILITGMTNAQIVNIPDANFKAKLIELGVDTNADGQIQESEALVVTTLDVYNSNITSLTGILAFQNLQMLFCYDNQITSELNLTTLGQLVILECGNNQISELNVSGLNFLITLRCDNNQLTSLNFTNCPNLDYIDCSYNLLTSLDLSGLTILNIFHCYNNSITNFNFTNVVIFNDFMAYNNQISDLDLSMANLSGYADFSLNTLQTINIKNGFSEDLLIGNFIIYSPNPTIQFICADNNELDNVVNYLTSNGLTNVVVNSYCSFTPGGNYNTITGTVTFDANNNGCDNNDIYQPNIRVNINDGTNQGATFTNNTGNYNFYTQAGSFAITPAIENPTWFTFSPTTATIPFANNNNNTATQNFCIAPNGVHPDLEIVIAPITPARPGFDATYKIVYKNKGNQTLSGNVTFSYDDAVLDFVSATVVLNPQSVGTLSWNYTNLLPFESRSVVITLNVNAPTETPAVNIGDQLDFNATITPIASDEIPADNVFSLKQIVVGSYDPNDITCLEGDIVSPSEIGNYLHYNIRFENTGTAPAEFVVVKVEVNQTDFDMNSLQIMNSSDPVDARINQNIVEFIFQNIQLETGGHGNILLKIKSKNNLLVGDEVNKKANIYFDYNFPILTNDAETVFQSLNNPDFQNDSSISVYPNPTNGIVTVNSNNSIKSIQLYDVQGRLLQTNLVNENETSIDVSTKAKGVYFLKILSDKGMKVEKIVRE
jgi:hypothetical protein